MPSYPPPAPLIPPVQEPKKKKTGVIIAVVIAAVLLCCIAISVIVVLYLAPLAPLLSEGKASGYPGIETPNVEVPSIIAPQPKDNGNTPNKGDEVLVDSDILTISIDTGSGKVEDYLDAYTVDCTVENKTDRTVGIYFDFDTSIDGVDADSFNTLIFPDTEEDFLPQETLGGSIVFLTTSPSGTITNLKGTLIVYDTATFETLGEYPVSIAKL
jgi:hypothetical protein